MLQAGQKAVFHCAGTLEDGYVFLDTWAVNEPMQVTIGDGTLLPSLERELCTFERGERSTFTISAAQAYGIYDPSLVFSVPAESFPNTGNLPIGGYITVNLDSGPVRLKVVKIEDGKVWFDSNHELAGHNLTFEVELLSDGTETVIDPSRLSVSSPLSA